MQQSGKISKAPVLVVAFRALEVQHAGGAPVGQWFLSNQVLWKMKIELGNLHFLDYSVANSPYDFQANSCIVHKHVEGWRSD